jgi:hypothetical protein
MKPKKPNQTEPKLKKTKKNKAKPEKPSQTGLNWFCPKKPNRTETSRFEPVLVFFFKFSLIIFFNKNRIELKMITHIINY